VLPQQVGHRQVGEETAVAEHDEVVGGLLHLAHQVAGDQHGAALVGEVAQQLPHPPDALGVQAVHRLVQHEDVGVAEQRPRDAEALSHAEGEAAHAVVGDALDADELDDLVHPRPGQAVALREGEQVRVRRPPRMPGARVDQGPHAAHRAGQVAVGPAEHGHPSRGGPGQPEDAAHRRRLAGAVRAEEAGDPARLDGHGEIVDGDAGAVLLGQAVDLDHAPSMASATAGPEEARPVATTPAPPFTLGIHRAWDRTPLVTASAVPPTV
jgi:hypothetical protein